MNMLNRTCNIPESYSFLLIGSRGTGKSTLLRQTFREQQTLWVDLLDVDLRRRFEDSPGLFKQMVLDQFSKVPNGCLTVVIDEIQKVPDLLNTVHSLIESHGIIFAITGSSARKLKGASANLLAGRAFIRRLYPLTYFELGSAFNLSEVLSWGSLPRVTQFNRDVDRKDFLKAYADTYLREEILMEQLVRKGPAFRRFLEVAAQSAGKIVNFSKIARDTNCDPVTIQNYFELLDDTLLLFLLPPYHASIRKRQRQNPKAYFFDLGVQRALANQLDIPPLESTYLFGDYFESWLIHEVLRLAEYGGKSWRFSYLRTKNDAEIDLIIERPGLTNLAIEIKSTDSLKDADIMQFSKLASDLKNTNPMVVSRDPIARRHENVNCLPWNVFLEQLSSGLIN